jgi:hypothetical protein
MQRMWKWVRGLDPSLVIHYEHTAGTRVLKNVVGQSDGKVERYRANLVRLRDNFLAHVAVLTKVAVLEAGE